MKKTLEKGYTLLFAVITSALVLGVAVFIVSIASKQFQLSVSARDSLYSFYAADAGIECAALAYANGNISTSTGAIVSCAGVTAATATFSSASPGYPTIFSTVTYPVYQSSAVLNFGFTGGSCAVITMFDGYAADGKHWAVIDSRGYNHCTGSNTPDLDLPNTVERALRLSKQG